MMKFARVFAVAVCSAVILTGCSSSDNREDKKQDGFADSFKSIFLEKKELEFYPDGLTDGGEEIWGNGKRQDGDIFSVLEKKIWGDNAE